VVGAILLAVGLFAASMAYTGLVVRRIVTDGDVATTAASAALEDETVQALLVDETASAIGSQLLGDDTIRSLVAFGYDPSADLDAIATAVVADPSFRAAFVATVNELHRIVLVSSGPAPIVDLTPLVDTARTAAIARNEAYIALFPARGSLRVSLPVEDLPDLTGASSALESRARLAAGAAVVLVGAAMLVHPRRPRVLRRVGTWAIGIGLTQAALGMLLPVAASRIPGDLQPVAHAVAETLRPRLLVPAAMVVVVGVAFVVSAWRWQRSLDGGLERLGAHAFLGQEADQVVPTWDGPIELASHRSPMGAPPVPRVSIAAEPFVRMAGDGSPTTHRAG
jgi:hypothetical protein